MKHGLVIAFLAGCVAIAGAAAPRGSKDAAAVESFIRAAARAFTEFPRTLDMEGILDRYAPDFRGIENGEETTLVDQRELLRDLREQLSSGVPVILSLEAKGIRVRVDGDMAIATYDYRFRIGITGEFVDDEAGKCTAVLEKTDGRWVFRHEHCSAPCPPCEDDEGEPEGDGVERLTPERT
jgi:ketosteroid isomerase-like protein